MRGRSVLVVGDLMIDEWIWGTVTRISPEAPVPVVAVADHSFTLGGAGNVANNLRALDARVSFAGTVGDDEFAAQIRRLLREEEVDDAGVFTASDRPTTRKTRIVAHNQQVVRADWESAPPMAARDRERIAAFVRERAASSDAVILSDYAKGLLSRELVEAALLCPLVVADPKPAEHRPLHRRDVRRAERRRKRVQATGITIVDEASLDDAGARLLERLNCRYVVITRGEHGMALFGRDGERLRCAVGRAHRLRRQRRGRHVGRRARACARGRRADRTSDAARELCRRRRRRKARHRNRVGGRDPRAGRRMDAEKLFGQLLDLDAASAWREEQRAAERCVVFTNGCFDVLHAGHVEYLAWARAQGDALIVGLNDDESVRRIKGDAAADRAVRATRRGCSALRSVDVVVGFGERTPEVLLDRIRPDVHVKSDQYREDELPERTVVLQHGGVIRARSAPSRELDRPNDRAHPRALRVELRSLVRIALTANGPGEVAGWVRPLLQRLYERAPRERGAPLPRSRRLRDRSGSADRAGVLSASARLRPEDVILRFALRSAPEICRRASTSCNTSAAICCTRRALHARLGGVATTYKFSRRAYRRLFDRAFAVDERNAEQLASVGHAAGAHRAVGNLAIDGALSKRKRTIEPDAPATAS